MAPDSLPSFHFLSDVEGAELRKAYEDAGQSQVFQYVDTRKCTESETAELIAQLRSIDLPRLNDLLRSGLLEEDSHHTTFPANSDTVGQPGSSIVPLPCIAPSSAVRGSHRELGISAIKSGQVAAVTLAGGQGTRLGFAGPKGIYDIGLPSGKSLFQLMAERLKRLAHIATASRCDNDESREEEKDVHIPWYIMTSPQNDSKTMIFFLENRFFGLPEGSVKFFRQQTLPCLSSEGKLILEGRGRIAMAPDGNGGVYSAMENNGILKDMTRKGVKYLHIFGVDNALIKPVDPAFIGYCISQNAECGNKCVQKTSPDEKVGIFARKNGKACVIEYRDLRDESSHDSSNQPRRLVFGAANICSHFFTLKFIINKVIPFVNSGSFYHVARKKNPIATGPDGVTVTPSEPNCIKLESFIFDVLSLSNSVAMTSQAYNTSSTTPKPNPKVEVTREDEFAPVKNATGLDSPETARALLDAQARRWLNAVGSNVIAQKGCCEVSPLVSYGGEGMERFRGKKVESIS